MPLCCLRHKKTGKWSLEQHIFTLKQFGLVGYVILSTGDTEKFIWPREWPLGENIHDEELIWNWIWGSKIEVGGVIIKNGFERFQAFCVLCAISIWANSSEIKLKSWWVSRLFFKNQHLGLVCATEILPQRSLPWSNKILRISSKLWQICDTLKIGFV